MNAADARRALTEAGYLLADRPTTLGRLGYTNEIVLSVAVHPESGGPIAPIRLLAIGVLFEKDGDVSDRDVAWYVDNAGKTGLADRVSCIAPPMQFRAIEWLPSETGYPHAVLAGDFHDFDTAHMATRGRFDITIFNDAGVAVFKQHRAVGFKSVPGGIDLLASLRAPAGQYRVLCVKPKTKLAAALDWHHGDFATRREAVKAARATASTVTFAYVYNEHASCSYCVGGPHIWKEDGYRRR